jgi:menaquinone-dependent protoporphyrinogen oxidase
MKVLVTAASRHGATFEIARQIGDTLMAAGFDVDVRRPEKVESVAPFDAVVIGSAVYAGRWLEQARRLIDREETALRNRPVWLFSSGPLGDPPKPDAALEGLGRLGEATHAIEHRVFAGKADRKTLGFTERAIFAVVKAPEGDFRPWEAVAEWASEIAQTLETRRLRPASPA